MELPKLLIADGGDEFRQALAGVLSERYAVRTCSNGVQALELLRAFRPDILVTDLMLPQLDGLTLLQLAFQEGIRPRVLVTATYFSDYIRGTLDRLGVDYYMQKPCSLQALAYRIADFTAADAPAAINTVQPEDWVSATLLRLGIGAHLDGFRYLQIAIPHFRQDTHQAITKELYVAVAETCGKEAKQVERSIRSAIENAWKRRTDRIWAEYFSPGPDGTIPKLSNGKFIAHMAQLLTEEANNQRSA